MNSEHGFSPQLKEIFKTLQYLRVKTDNHSKVQCTKTQNILSSSFYKKILSYCIFSDWSHDKITLLSNINQKISFNNFLNDCKNQKYKIYRKIIKNKICIQSGIYFDAGSELDTIIFKLLLTLKNFPNNIDELGIEFFIFAGAYGKTPTGIHYDYEHTYLINIGPNHKEFYIEKKSKFKKFLLKPNSIIFFPFEKRHYALAEKFSVSLGMNIYLKNEQEIKIQYENLNAYIWNSKTYNSFIINETKNLFYPGSSNWLVKISTNAGLIIPPIPQKINPIENILYEILPQSWSIIIPSKKNIAFLVIRGWIIPIFDIGNMESLSRKLKNALPVTGFYKEINSYLNGFAKVFFTLGAITIKKANEPSI